MLEGVWPYWRRYVTGGGFKVSKAHASPSLTPSLPAASRSGCELLATPASHPFASHHDDHRLTNPLKL